MTTVASSLAASAVTVTDSTSFAALAVYVVVSASNAGDRPTSPKLRDESVKFRRRRCSYSSSHSGSQAAVA